MRTWTETRREGTNMGPVDWTHPAAKDMPPLWREAELNPRAFLLASDTGARFEVVAVAMYDGWPYWEPRPAVQILGPLGSTEWRWFDSYGVGPRSIIRKPEVSP